ncbi:MAG: hypothetical protein L0Y57_15700 [Beijerinckiaceae bacterium]|nr:hypothetical protein [Beijerinckiaceae bacterium]
MPSDQPEFSVENYPLIVFVHVPKKGGTTVGKVLWQCSHRGQGAWHKIPLRDLSEVARRADWIGGHLGKDIFAASLDTAGRQKEYFAIIREPVSHLLSNLNWLFEIYNRGPLFFWTCGTAQRLLSAEVRATDFSKASSVIAILRRYKGNFFNRQSRAILGNDFAAISSSEAARRLASYTYIAVHENLSALYPAFGFARLPKEICSLHENAAQRYYFDTSLFESQEILDFLAQHHAHDFRLYDRVRQTSWPVEGRDPFRPAFQLVTASNYDEQAYLDFNLDVANGLKGHRTWRSGRDHFDAQGYAEQRRQVFMPRYAGYGQKVHGLEIAHD